MFAGRSCQHIQEHCFLGGCDGTSRISYNLSSSSSPTCMWSGGGRWRRGGFFEELQILERMIPPGDSTSSGKSLQNTKVGAVQNCDGGGVSPSFLPTYLRAGVLTACSEPACLESHILPALRFLSIAPCFLVGEPTYSPWLDSSLASYQPTVLLTSQHLPVFQPLSLRSPPTPCPFLFKSNSSISAFPISGHLNLKEF